MPGLNPSTEEATKSTGAEAAAAPASLASRPLLLRTLVGAMAIIGLSGIGAASMLAGLDGAHASPPEAASIWLPTSASAAPATAASPSASAAVPELHQTDNEVRPQGEAPETPAAVAPCPTLTEDGKVILNRAKEGDLRKIPGVGPKRATAIVSLRSKLKRFRRDTELLRVKGIGPKSLVKMRAHFVLDDPKGNSCEKDPTQGPS